MWKQRMKMELDGSREQKGIRGCAARAAGRKQSLCSWRWFAPRRCPAPAPALRFFPSVPLAHDVCDLACQTLLATVPCGAPFCPPSSLTGSHCVAAKRSFTPLQQITQLAVSSSLTSHAASATLRFSGTFLPQCSWDSGFLPTCSNSPALVFLLQYAFQKRYSCRCGLSMKLA